ncbi:MAG: hypothetical protein ACXVB9_15100 [Bdellovibrionota bacterium]
MTRGSRILGLVGRLLAVVLVSGLVLALCFEIYLRRAGFLEAQPANYPCVAGDPVLNHVFRADCQGLATATALKTAHDAHYRTNLRGYRGHAPEAGKRVIVAIGDSYTEGFGLEEEQAFPAVLERALRAKGATGWQVLNGGTLGYSPALYSAYFDRFFLLEHPELVVLNLDFSDFNDDPYFLQIADYDSQHQPVAFPGREALPDWLMPYVYSNRSALLRFLHQEINQWSLISHREQAQWNMDQWIHSEKTLIAPADLKAAALEGCAKPVEAIAKHILILKQHAAAVGARFAVHMYPPGSAVKTYANLPQGISFVRVWDAKHRTDYSWACGISPKIVDVMRSFAQRQGIPFFDSFPIVMAQHDKETLYYDRDAHWNERGVKLVAENLAPQLLPLLKKNNR